MRRTLAQVVAVAGVWLACTIGTGAQTAAPPTAADKDQHRISDQDVALLRKDLRSQKKQLIAQNLKLSDAANATEGSLVSSEKNNVKLESGTLLLLRVN